MLQLNIVGDHGALLQDFFHEEFEKISHNNNRKKYLIPSRNNWYSTQL